MSFQNIIQQAQTSGDFQPLVDSIPYAGYIGLEFQRFGDNVIFKLPRNPDNIGNPILPAIHGGVIGGFMELSAAINLLMFMDTPLMPKIGRAHV